MKPSPAKPEILNIEYHTRRLLLKALNSTTKKAEARRITGLPERTFFNYLDYYKVRQGKDGVFYSDKVVEYKIIKVAETNSK